MTAKEKAQELVNMFTPLVDIMDFYADNTEFIKAKRCATICVDEIIKSHTLLGKELFSKVGTESYKSRCINHDLKEYWNRVKQEIEKL